MPGILPAGYDTRQDGRVRPLPEPPPYGETAVRPEWSGLPADVRAAVEGRLGATVTAAASARGGFTDGFASVLTTAGGRVFVKAAPVGTPLADWYAREAAVTAALPAGIRAARPRWTLTAAGHTVLCLDAVDGRVPALPWRPAELTAALDAWAAAAALLRHPPDALAAVGLPPLAALAREDLSWWAEIAAGREAVPPGTEQHVAELVALERRLVAYAEGADGVIHGDLRVDNLLVDGAGAAWLCDWTWPCRGPGWFDTATLLVTAHAGGLDTDALFATHPTAAGAPPDALDAALAALAGHWLVRAADPPRAGSPHSRAHQAFSGWQALAWLARRQGWPSGRFGGLRGAW
jgi:aminoglycoside phosphotransferase (APT) family kinase protein